MEVPAQDGTNPNIREGIIDPEDGKEAATPGH